MPIQNRPINILQLDEPIETDEPTPFGRADIGVDVNKPEPEETGTWEAVTLAFAEENTIGAAVQKAIDIQDRPEFKPVEGYDPFEGKEIDGYWEHADEFDDVTSPEETAYIKSMIDRRNERLAKIVNAGVDGYAALIAAGTLDPINFIPIGGWGFKAYKTAKTINNLDTAMDIAKGAAIGAAAVGTQETILHQIQPGRTAEESMYAVGGATVISGALTGIAHGLGKAELDRLTRELDADTGRRVDGNVRPDDSVGAARAAELTLEERTHVDNVVTKAFDAPLKVVRKGVNKALGLPESAVHMSVGEQMRNSNNVAVRKIGDILMSRSTITKGEMEGKPTKASVEQRIHIEKIKNTNLLGDIIDDYKSLPFTKRMGRNKFMKRVTKVALTGRKDAVEAVNVAARRVRSYFDDQLKVLDEKGLINPELLRWNYVPQIWDFNAIEKNTNLFLGKLEDHIKRMVPEEYWDEVPDIALNLKDNLTRTSPTHIKLPVSKTEAFENIRGGRGPKKLKFDRNADETILSIDFDNFAQFLKTDMEDILTQYNRTVTPEIVFKDVFDDAGKLSDITQEAHTQYQKLVQAAKEKGDEKLVKELTEEWRNDKANIERVYQRLKGTEHIEYANDLSYRASTFLRNWAFVTMLGKMTLSATPDMFKPVQEYGLRRYAGSMIKTFKMMAADRKAYNISKANMRKFGTMMELISSERSMAFADIIFENTKRTKAGGHMEYIASKMGKITLMNQWNTVWKTFSGLMSNDFFIENALKLAKGQKLSQKTIAKLANAGIGKEQAEIMLKEFEAGNIEKIGGLWTTDIDKWTNFEAAREYKAGVSKTVDQIIVTPSIEDMPKFLDGKAAAYTKLMMQFKSFILASENKTFSRGVQLNDFNTYTGWAMMAFMGAASEWAHLQINDENIPDDPKYWAYNGIDRAGIVPLLELSNMADRMGLPSIQSMLDLEKGGKAKQFTPQLFDVAIGPGGGIANKTFDILKDFATGETDDKTIKNINRLTPYRNTPMEFLPSLYMTKGPIQAMEEATAEFLGVKGDFDPWEPRK